MSLINLKKRLEIIKMLIQLGDLKDIRTHLFNCSTEINNFPLNSFLFLLEKKENDRLLLEIDKVINQINSKKIDPLSDLKKVSAKLTSDIQALEIEKQSLKICIEEFEKRYHDELGQKVLKIAYYEQMKINEQTHSTYSLNEIKTKKPQKKTNDLSRDEFETLLKQQFRKATKLCHPDSNEKANVQNIDTKFVELKEHLQNKNLHAINEMIKSLEPYQNQQIVTPETKDKYKLEFHIRELQHLKMRHLDEVAFLKSTQSYQTISSNKDLDAYFIEQKTILETKIDGFKRKLA